MSMTFEWDDEKNARNIASHGVDFAQAAKIFLGPHVEEYDDRFDYGETRYVAYGLLDGIALLAVAYTQRGAAIRLISARRATRSERRRYEEKIFGGFDGG